MVIQAGEAAPEFTLEDDQGNKVSLSDYRGQRVVLYFYPRDDTPGCTVEAKGFRDSLDAIEAQGAAVLGVSPDTVESHRKFKEKYGLNFPLLADPDHAVCEAFGVWGTKKMYGREFEGVHRTTFVIDGEGAVERVYENVRPKGHCEEVVAGLQ